MAKVKRKLPAGTAIKKKFGSKGADGPVLELSLPKAKSTPSARLQDYTTLLFGERKIGKTDLTSYFSGTFHMMTEPGGKALAIFQRPVDSWKGFAGYVRLLEKDKTFDTATVDTADLLYKYCSDYIMAKRGIEHPSDEAYGKGWSAVRDEFTKWILRLIATGKGIIFISHAIEKKIKMRDGEEYDMIQPSMAGQALDILTALVDLWFYYGYDGKQRVLTIQGSDHIGAGHRLKNNFKYPDGTPIREIDMGASAQEGYNNLIAAFNNTYTKKRKPTVEVDEDSDTPKVVVKKKKLAIRRK